MKPRGVNESRSHRRLLDAPLLVSYTIGDDFAPARTETYDLGLGGLAMLSAVELSAGQPLTLELELRGDSREPLRLTGEVRWCRFDPLIEKFRTGVEFTGRGPELEQKLLHYIDTMYKLRDLGVL